MEITVASWEYRHNLFRSYAISSLNIGERLLARIGNNWTLMKKVIANFTRSILLSDDVSQRKKLKFNQFFMIKIIFLVNSAIW